MIPVRIHTKSVDERKASWKYASTPRGVVKLCAETKSILLVDSFTLPSATPQRVAVYTSLLQERFERHILAILSQSDKDQSPVLGFEVEIKHVYLIHKGLEYYRGKGDGFPTLETLYVEYIVLGYAHDVYIKDPQALMVEGNLAVRDLPISEDAVDHTILCQQVVASLCRPRLPSVDETRALCEELAKDPLGHPNEMQRALANAADLIRELQDRVEGLALPVCKI